DVPDPDVHRRGQAVLPADPVRDELPAVHVATDLEAVPDPGTPHVLHLELELVGEEVRGPVVDHVPTEEYVGRCAPLTDRLVPVLDPHPITQGRVPRPRDVPDREDSTGGGL